MRLISWNIQWGRGGDGVVDLRRTADVLYRLDPDVICLQEVATNHPGLPGNAGMDQVALLRGLFLGFDAAYHAPSDIPDGLGGRRCFGNLLLSRRPLGVVRRHALPQPPDGTVPAMPRGALEAVIDAPWGPLRVLTTHLEFYSLRQRRAQLAALRDIVAAGDALAAEPPAAGEADPPFAVYPAGDGAILCGDFNCPPEAAEMRALLHGPDAADAAAPTGGAAAVPPASTPARPPLVDAWRIATPDREQPATAGFAASPYFPAPVCLDRAYLSQNLAFRLRAAGVEAGADALAASDHLPLVLDFSDTP